MPSETAPEGELARAAVFVRHSQDDAGRVAAVAYEFGVVGLDVLAGYVPLNFEIAPSVESGINVR